jgi:hypothetical protein
MGKYLSRVVMVACIAGLTALPLAAQKGTTIQTKGVQGQANTKDTHINSDSMENLPGQKVVAPASKGGPMAKGPGCVLHINNSTAWNVQFYFNGNLTGVIGAYGDYYPSITLGNAQLYARALFTNGTVYTFGPINYDCAINGSTYTWTLNP